ncbi:MAG: efflux RND transporter permease subunit, partial [Chlamydiia bacterium]|nr:efflux RND transporter permease subunit [Chlamydiia bacterium]
FCSFLLFFAGVGSYYALGQLEDPEFTVKSASVVTNYPGASPEEVEQEVTETLELKIQELHQVDYLESFSRAGQSYITVYIKPHYRKADMAQIFDDIRKKVSDATSSLPPGVQTPRVVDDVGEVYGFLLAVVGDGFTPHELKQYADDVRRELSLIEGAARVNMWGDQQEAIYVDVSHNKLHELGISPQTLMATLSSQNLVVNAGSIDVGDQRLRIEATGVFRSPTEIENLTFRASQLDRIGEAQTSSPDTLLRLKDFATVRRAYREPPQVLMRYDGKPSIGLAVAVVEGGNVVDLGHRIDARLEELKAFLPVGIEFHRVAWQSDLVDESIRGFMISLLEAVVIVLVILWLSMGWNNAYIVGTALIMTILGTFVVMAGYHIDLQRMSLGALVIALGMMVDNAIVVADGATVRMQSGMERMRAAVEAASSTAWPLLGATVIAVSFFYPIYASTQSTGEYCASLFQVVAISLLLSWVVSMTITPLQCMVKLEPAAEGEEVDPYDTPFYKSYRKFLVLCLHYRFMTLGAAVAVLLSAFFLWPFVPQMFFPDSSRLQFMVDYWAPEGTRIQQVAEDLRQLEDAYLNDERVVGVASFIGAGPPRFYLPVEPEKPYQSYAQLIVNIRSLRELNGIIEQSSTWAQEHVPQAMVRVRKYAVGPGVPFKFEARITGPGSVALNEIRELGEKGTRILEATPLAKDIQTDWRQRTNFIEAAYSQDKGRWTSITRSDLARGLQIAYDGVGVGLYREEDELIPIVVRSVESERQNLANL